MLLFFVVWFCSVDIFDLVFRVFFVFFIEFVFGVSFEGVWEVVYKEVLDSDFDGEIVVFIFDIVSFFCGIFVKM